MIMLEAVRQCLVLIIATVLFTNAVSSSYERSYIEIKGKQVNWNSIQERIDPVKFVPATVNEKDTFAHALVDVQTNEPMEDGNIDQVNKEDVKFTKWYKEQKHRIKRQAPGYYPIYPHLPSPYNTVTNSSLSPYPAQSPYGQPLPNQGNAGWPNGSPSSHQSYNPAQTQSNLQGTYPPYNWGPFNPTYNNSQPAYPSNRPSQKPVYNPSQRPYFNPAQPTNSPYGQPSYNNSLSNYPSYNPGQRPQTPRPGIANYNPSQRPPYQSSNNNTQSSYSPHNQHAYNPSNNNSYASYPSYNPGQRPQNPQSGYSNYNPSQRPPYQSSNNHSQQSYPPHNQPAYNPSVTSYSGLPPFSPQNHSNGYPNYNPSQRPPYYSSYNNTQSNYPLYNNTYQTQPYNPSYPNPVAPFSANDPRKPSNQSPYNNHFTPSLMESYQSGGTKYPGSPNQSQYTEQNNFYYTGQHNNSNDHSKTQPHYFS